VVTNLIIVLVMILIGALPTWPSSQARVLVEQHLFLGLAAIVLVVLLLMGRT
jgi:hypothetical protein